MPSIAAAGTHTLNFDADAPGTVVGSGPAGLTFGGVPIVFSAGTNATSPPNGLRRPGDCPDPPSGGMFGQCASGANRLEMNFTAGPARVIQLRAGIPATGPCFETDCPQARLVGFNASGNVVAVSPITDIFSQNMNSNAAISITSDAYDITRAVFAVGENPEPGGSGYFGYKHTAQVDNLLYDVQEGGDPPPPPPPGPPSVNITSPPEGQGFATTDVTIGGAAAAPAGIADMCAQANAPAAFPAACTRRIGTFADGTTFQASFIPGMRPGPNEIRVWVRDTRGRVATDTVNVIVASGEVDYAIETMEVTQAIQTKTLPSPDETLAVPDLGSDPLPADTYDGVPLAAGKQTMVRLYGEARGAAAALRGVPALIHGYRMRSGRPTELPGSPIAPTGNPAAVNSEADVPVLRASATGAWTFVLPSGWRDAGSILLIGEIAPGLLTSPARDCCTTNNFFALQGIPFSAVRSSTVFPVPLDRPVDEGGPTVSLDRPMSQWYSELLKVWPGRMGIAPARAAIDVTGSTEDLNAMLLRTYRDAGLDGKISGLLPGNGGGAGPGPTSVTATASRKLDLVAHEVGHSLNLAHAMSGDACTDPNGGDIGTIALRGNINGVGLDPGMWSGGTPGHFKPIAAEEPGVFDATPDAPNFVYDYMSYCSVDFQGKTWVSTGYWATTVRELRSGGSIITGFTAGCCGLGAASDPTVVPRGALGGEPTVSVSAALRPGANEILDIQTGNDPPEGAQPGSDVEVVVRDASGAEVSRTPVSATPLEQRPGPGEPVLPDGRFVNAIVPGPGAASVEVVVGGVVAATRAASANAPEVELRSPRNGAKLGAKGNLRIEWSASDADGDALVSTVQFSPDRGRTWKPLGVVEGGESLRVAAAELPRASRGELRVTVADGFRTATDSAERLESEGGPPEATIVSPPSGTRIASDAPVILEGQAFDAAGQQIAGRRLVWTSGKARLGTGGSVDATGYELGSKVKLQARDAAGHVDSNTVRLKVQKVAPFFTVLEPRALGDRAKKIDLRVASSLPGTLKVSGKGIRGEGFDVGPREEGIELGLKGGARPEYELKLKLSAFGKRTRSTLAVQRAG
jgi:hypothetical protein